MMILHNSWQSNFVKNTQCFVYLEILLLSVFFILRIAVMLALTK